MHALVDEYGLNNAAKHNRALVAGCPVGEDICGPDCAGQLSRMCGCSASSMHPMSPAKCNWSTREVVSNAVLCAVLESMA
jgi:hypothetical protein